MELWKTHISQGLFSLCFGSLSVGVMVCFYGYQMTRFWMYDKLAWCVW